MAAQRRCFLEVAFLVALATASIQASTSWHMTDFINSLEEVESRNPGLEPVALLKALRQSAGLNDPYTQLYLGTDNATVPAIAVALSVYFAKALIHSVKADGTEEGVLLTPDGTTVALAPVLLGLEAGLQGHVLGSFQLTLARDLGRLFTSDPALQFQAPDGCWDNPASPRVFRLAGAGSPVTTALVNGGMDGVLLGLAAVDPSGGPVSASGLLREYYGGGDGGGVLLYGFLRLRGALRRENFKVMVWPALPVHQVVTTIEVQRQLEDKPLLNVEERQTLMTLLNEWLKEFALKFMECPAIIPRCMWRAKPYKGTPTLLSPPLTHVYIHHTELPSAPCQTFEQCSAVMRSIQRYHQEERGWDDIGYSFAVGSDGYIYEGRGWRWRGAHTGDEEHNAKGYGVAFIGDYSSTLPSDESLELVSERLAGCAVARGLLVADYAVQGHRQVKSTSCPGDELYDEIRYWEHWKPTKDKVAGN